VATNMAIQLRRQTDARVLIVDLDLVLGEVALYLGIEPRYGIVDLASNLHRLDGGLLASYIASHESGVDVLAAPFDPDEGRWIGAEEVGKIIEYLRGVYDWIVVDASDSLDSRVVSGLRTAEEIFVITQVDVPSLRNIQRVRRVLKRVTPERAPRIVINRFHPSGDITLKDVERTLGLEVFGTLSNDYGSIAHSINAGEPLVMGADSTCEQEMWGLVGKITGTPVQPEKKPRWQLRRRSPKKRAGGIAVQSEALAGAEP
jgi:pilus assembly protein CpaE